MVLWVEDTAPVQTKAIDSDVDAVNGYLAESVDNC